MSAAVTSSPANQDRPLLTHSSSPQPSDQRRIRTLHDLLTMEKMDGGDRIMRREGENNNVSKWKILRERLGLKAISCCGVATWRYENSSTLEEENGNVVVLEEQNENVGSTATGMMNLGAALAAERQFRAAENDVMMTPSRVSLMRLLEDTRSDGCDLERESSSNDIESVCCVCMGRRKGAALIPCGHTYCRVCSKELWLNRGSCPLCNRRILEILDIF